MMALRSSDPDISSDPVLFHAMRFTHPSFLSQYFLLLPCKITFFLKKIQTFQKSCKFERVTSVHGQLCVKREAGREVAVPKQM